MFLIIIRKVKLDQNGFKIKESIYNPIYSGLFSGTEYNKNFQIFREVFQRESNADMRNALRDFAVRHRREEIAQKIEK